MWIIEGRTAPMLQHQCGADQRSEVTDRMARSQLTPEERAEYRKEYNRKWAKAHPRRPRKPLTPEQKERKRESNRRSAEKNREKENEAKRRWREANREYFRQYYRDHKHEPKPPQSPEQRERKRQTDREYHLKHKDSRKPLTPEQRVQKRQWDREYSRKNAEQAKARAAAWYAANRERAKESRRLCTQGPKREEYLAQKLQSDHKRRALKRASSGSYTRADITRIFEEQNGQCATCKCVLVKQGTGKYHIDHVIPLIRGGSNGPENLQLLCPSCNLRKNQKTPEEWAKANGRLFI